jgi:indole-3-glycerol phosphate synthase
MATSTRATILDEILIHKRAEVAQAQRAVTFDRVQRAARDQAPVRPFAAALRPAQTGTVRLIAEIKKSSPSKGSLAPALDVPATARLYGENGAAAMSVLTDTRFFGGTLTDLQVARAQVAIPVLRKDFMIAPYQLFEARAAGADAALLIVAALASPLADVSDLDRPREAGEPDLRLAAERLASLLMVAREAGLECLVEVHDEAELDVALGAGSRVVGINNRDLRTFETRLEVTERLAPRVPHDVILVSESGIAARADVERVRRAGASAVLVGSSIVSSPDPAAKVRELAGVTA